MLQGVKILFIQREVTHVQIQLQLSEGVNNSFEYFEIHIPFFHRQVKVRYSMHSSVVQLVS